MRFRGVQLQRLKLGSNPRSCCNGYPLAGVASRPEKVASRPGKVAGRPGKVAGRPGKVARRPGKVAGRPGKVARRPGKVGGPPGKVARRPRRRGACRYAPPSITSSLLVDVISRQMPQPDYIVICSKCYCL